MSKHIFAVAACKTPKLQRMFGEAVDRGDYARADFLWKVEVAALRMGNYDLAEQTDREELEE